MDLMPDPKLDAANKRIEAQGAMLQELVRWHDAPAGRELSPTETTAMFNRARALVRDRRGS